MSGLPPLRRRLLGPLAGVNAALHLAGLACAAVWMAPGTPLAGLAERRAYLAGEGALGWGLSWGLWMTCGLAFLAFAATVVECLPARGALARLAFGLVCVAVAIDLTSDVLLAAALPELARWPDDGPFRVLERGCGLAGVVVANGCYALAVLAMSAHLHVAGLGSRPALALGALTAVAGLIMVGAGFADDPHLLRNTTGPTIGGFALWSLAVARDARRWA